MISLTNKKRSDSQITLWSVFKKLSNCKKTHGCKHRWVSTRTFEFLADLVCSYIIYLSVFPRIYTYVRFKRRYTFGIARNWNLGRRDSRAVRKSSTRNSRFSQYIAGERNEWYRCRLTEFNLAYLNLIESFLKLEIETPIKFKYSCVIGSVLRDLVRSTSLWGLFSVKINCFVFALQGYVSDMFIKWKRLFYIQ